MFKNILAHFRQNSLFQNAVYLMFSTGSMAVFGFLFWILNAKLYTAHQIGLATTILSVMDLITSFSLFGSDTGLIRYLPKSIEKNRLINTSLTISALLSLLFSSVFIVGVHHFSPQLLFIRHNLWLICLFIIYSVFYTANNLVEAVFIALRSTKYIFIKNTLFSILKLALPLFFVSLGAFGIFNSWMISMIVAIIYCLLILFSKYHFELKPLVDKQIISEIGHYSFANFIAGYLSTLPRMILPLIITNRISPESTAYFYMVMMIINLLWIVPQATTQSLFAEGSHDLASLRLHISKSIKIIALILTPATVIIIFLGKYLLLILGKNYSNGGVSLLQLLALSSLFVAINSVYNAIYRVEKLIRPLILANLVSAISTIGFSYLFISFGLTGIGIAWILGQIIQTIFLYLFRRHQLSV